MTQKGGTQSTTVIQVLSTSGGEVEGHMVFGQGLRGELRIQGNFGDGYLSYEGHVE